VEYAVSSAAATDIFDAIDEPTTPSIADVDARIEFTIDSDCHEGTYFDDDWGNEMTDLKTAR